MFESAHEDQGWGDDGFVDVSAEGLVDGDQCVGIPVGEGGFVGLLDFFASGMSSAWRVLVEAVDGVAGGDDRGRLVERREGVADGLAESVVVLRGTEADADDADGAWERVGEQCDGDAERVVGLLPDVGTGEREVGGIGGGDESLRHFLVDWVFKCETGMAEALEVAGEVAAERVESIERDDAVGGDQEESLHVEFS